MLTPFFPVVKWRKNRQKGKECIKKYIITMHLEDGRKELSSFKIDWLWLPMAPFLITAVVAFKL